MSRSSRRTFLGRLGAAAAIPAIGQAVSSRPQGGQSPVAYDLLIRGGRVIDPAQQLSGVRDVAIAGGRVARVAENIPATQARQVYDARGKIVTPGLIDMHTHVYQYAIRLSVDSDVVGFQNGVTTVLDCGSTGSGSFRACATT